MTDQRPAPQTGGEIQDDLPLPEIEDLIARGALFVISHSGGKDSQAMFISLRDRIPRNQLLVVHASLGEVEWEGAEDIARGQAEAAGVPFIVAKAVKTFFEMVEHRYAVRPGPNSSCWPSATIRACTSDLKRGPIEREVRRYAKANGHLLIVSCMGMRAAESPARAKRTTFVKSARNSVAGRQWFEWLPIHDMTTEEVFDTIQAAGEQPHWAYAAGNRRLSCVFCILAHPKDLATGAAHRPELYAKYREIEERTGYTMHQSRKPLDELVAIGAAKQASDEQAVA